MRFEKPEYAQEDVHLKGEAGEAGARGSGSGGGGTCCDMEDGPAFCIPADGVHCGSCRWDAQRRACFKNDCDGLFTPQELRQQQREWAAAEAGAGAAPRQPQLVITAGPERSGSTWLYNSVRLLFQHARQPLDACWLKHVTDGALDARGVGQPGAHHVLVKTHAWSDDFDLRRATHVLVTHRDLRQVLASFRRMTWEFELPASFVEDHFKWKEVCELDIAFEDIICRPKALLQDLAARLGLEGQVDLDAVLYDVSHLPVPKDWVDPVTQIWPSHISAPYEAARKKAAAQAAAAAAGGDSAGNSEGNASSASPPLPSGDDGDAGSIQKGGSSLEAAMNEGMVPPTPTARAQLDAEAAQQLVQRFPYFFRTYGYA